MQRIVITQVTDAVVGFRREFVLEVSDDVDINDALSGDTLIDLADEAGILWELDEEIDQPIADAVENIYDGPAEHFYDAEHFPVVVYEEPNGDE